MRGNRGSDKGGGLADYMLPQRTCATCGRPTSGGRNPSSLGDWHYDCRRDEHGHLLVREPDPEKASS